MIAGVYLRPGAWYCTYDPDEGPRQVLTQQHNTCAQENTIAGLN